MAQKKTTKTSEPTKAISYVQMVAFVLDGEDYAIPISIVREVIRIPEITPVPQSPDFVRGIINLRGKIMPVVDLETKFALTRKNKESVQENVMILDAEPSQFGVLVDKVTEVLRVPEDAFTAAPSTIESKIGSDFVEGVVLLGNESKDGEERKDKKAADANSRMLLVLDLHKVMTAEERESIDVGDASVVSEVGNQKPTEVQKKPKKAAKQNKKAPAPSKKVGVVPKLHLPKSGSKGAENGGE